MHSCVVFKMKGGAPVFLSSFVQAASMQYTAKLPQDPTLPASLEPGPSRQQQALVKIQNKGPHASAKARSSKEMTKKGKRQSKFLKNHGEKPNMLRDDKTMSELMKGLYIDHDIMASVQADIFLFCLAI